VGDVEFERRVEEEAEAAHRRFLGDLRPRARLRDQPRGDWLTTVRPLVERLAAAEGERDGLRVSLAAAEDERAREAQRANAAEARHAERETECQTLAEEIGREREERAKREEGPRIPELEARIVALDRERSAALDELAKTWRRVVAAEDAVGDLEARTAGLEGERDEALSTVRRYEVQLAHVVGREATLRAALADARAGLRSMARELLGVDAGRAVVEVGS
jgi:chromosome segregation ATPase